MQVSSKAVISRFFDQYPGILMLPITEEYCKKLGLDKHNLLAMEFQITLSNDKVVLEGHIRDRPSSSESPPLRGDVQR